MREAEELRKRVRARLGEQRTLVQSLLRQRELLQGSVFARYGECGKEGCACRQGRKHGPYYVFSMRSGGKGAFAYLEGSLTRPMKRIAPDFTCRRKNKKG